MVGDRRLDQGLTVGAALDIVTRGREHREDSVASIRPEVAQQDATCSEIPGQCGHRSHPLFPVSGCSSTPHPGLCLPRHEKGDAAGCTSPPTLSRNAARRPNGVPRNSAAVHQPTELADHRGLPLSWPGPPQCRAVATRVPPVGVIAKRRTSLRDLGARRPGRVRQAPECHRGADALSGKPPDLWRDVSAGVATARGDQARDPDLQRANRNPAPDLRPASPPLGGPPRTRLTA